MMSFYTAVGTYRVKTEDGHSVAYIQKLGKLHKLTIPEFVIWSSLLWEVMNYRELRKSYYEQIGSVAEPVPDFDEMLQLLVQRKLVATGLGYTGADALYNMMSDAFLVPVREHPVRKTVSALKLLLKGRIGVSGLSRAFKCDERNEDEVRIMDLICQTPLSTAEVVRCFERGIYDVSTSDKVIDALYPEEDNDQMHIANEEMFSRSVMPVLKAVSGLYLTHQLYFELP